jgi:TPP-dependent pyruvate/acetoin dehydrogenase alpha subunit
LSEQQDQTIQAEANAEINAATRFAEESPWPSADEVATDVLAPIQEVA